jgi:hypothetical protein
MSASKHTINRYFQGLEVVDADFDLLIQPSEDDVKEAVPKDPSNCAYARCAKRLWGSTAVLFYRTISYVDLVINGVRKLYRFHHDDGLYERIVTFDRTSEMPPVAMKLRRPKPCQTLDGLRLAGERRKAQQKKSRKTRKQAHIKGERKIGPPILHDIRSGTGMVHFRKIRV